MSYSFAVWAASKAEAKTAVAEKVDQVVATQAVHARDRIAILANASAVIDLLGDVVPDGHEVYVSCNGSLGWIDAGSVADVPLRTASVSAVASYHRPLA
ncbi:hypothetical protein [Bradyrhizobium sp. HKCCYLR20261]|uniref:hypothetical protein n=1 Tax=Bradyrhizobium sp. HKCCYLR20261 TaxID=3420760 RepID=UPI003EBF9F38